MTWRFNIEGRLPALNEVTNENRTHRQAGARQKREWTEYCAWSIKAQSVPKINKPVVARITWYEKNKQRNPDNISTGQKYIFDGLQQVGVLTNDGWSQIRAIVHRFKIDKKRPRVEVVLRETQGVK